MSPRHWKRSRASTGDAERSETRHRQLCTVAAKSIILFTQPSINDFFTIASLNSTGQMNDGYLKITISATTVSPAVIPTRPLIPFSNMWASLVRVCSLSMAILALGISTAPASARADDDDPPEYVVQPHGLPEKTLSKHTSDDMDVELKLFEEKVASVPNLAGAANSHEGFVTVHASAQATGGKSPIEDSIFIVGYQLGCKADVSAGLQLGGTGGAIPSGEITVTPGSPATNAGTLGTAGGGAGFGQTVVQPGVIMDLPLSNMKLNTKGGGRLDVEDIHVKADACGGEVWLRSYAYLRISTTNVHTQYAIYGKPIAI
jgi:hypothetical protein